MFIFFIKSLRKIPGYQKKYLVAQWATGKKINLSDTGYDSISSKFKFQDAKLNWLFLEKLSDSGCYFKNFVITPAPTFTNRFVGRGFVLPAISCLKIICVHASGAIQVLPDLLFLFLHEHMLWVLFKSASLRRF